MSLSCALGLTVFLIFTEEFCVILDTCPLLPHREVAASSRCVPRLSPSEVSFDVFTFNVLKFIDFQFAVSVKKALVSGQGVLVTSPALSYLLRVLEKRACAPVFVHG